jgi:hypothetical protein
VCDVLRSQLLAAGAELRGLGVLHLALEPHPEGGLVTGWQQRLSAVVEPGAWSRLCAGTHALDSLHAAWTQPPALAHPPADTHIHTHVCACG